MKKSEEFQNSSLFFISKGNALYRNSDREFW